MQNTKFLAELQYGLPRLTQLKNAADTVLKIASGYMIMIMMMIKRQ